MALPITIPNTFAGATIAIPLSQLDNNFTTVVNGVNGIGNGTNSLANVSITGGSIANVTLTGTVTAPINGYRRNRIINGGMQIDQRNDGAAQTITVGSYTVDRWIVAPTGASITGQRVAGPSGYQYAYQMSGAASVTTIDFQQRIESANTADLVNQNVILSANISNSLLTTVTWRAFTANAVDNFGATTLIATGTFTVSGTSTQYTATFNAGANAANGIAINFSVGAQTSGTWTVTGVQLEAGSSSTPFERLPIGETLMLCQRYYEYGGVWQQVFGSASAGIGNYIGFLVAKRAAPSLAFVNTVYFNASSLSIQSAGISPTTGTGFMFANGSGYSYFTSNWTANSEF